MNTIEQIKTAIGEPLKRNIGGQEFEFYCLDVIELVNFYDISQRASEEKLTKEDMISLTNLIINMVKKAFPKDTSEDLINQFVIKYFFQLQEILIELHSPDVDKMTPQQKARIEQMRTKVLAEKNAVNSGTNQTTTL